MKFQGKMDAQPNGSVSGHQLLEAELTEKLEVVVLPEMSGFQEDCIYIVREGVRQVNPKAYTPQVVSIGPFHNPWGSDEENNMLKPMEELKLQYLKGFLNRTKLLVADILHKLDEFCKLNQWENKIRRCYAGPISYNSNDFLKMVIIDACFIIEYFLRLRRFYEWKKKDPLMSKPSLLGDIWSDLLLLENQLPFFVLEDIYNLTTLNLEFPSFVEITFHCFKYLNSQNINPEGVCPKHFTDLLRTFYLPSSFHRGQGQIDQKIPRQVYSASQLMEAGLVFKVSEDSKCLLALKFDKGVLTMPCFCVDDITETYLRNILAFEECHLPHSKYLSLYNSLNGFYENPLNKYKAIFIHEYFNTPVKIASTIAAMLLLLLTLIQTIFSVCSYFKE